MLKPAISIYARGWPTFALYSDNRVIIIDYSEMDEDYFSVYYPLMTGGARPMTYDAKLSRTIDLISIHNSKSYLPVAYLFGILLK